MKSMKNNKTPVVIKKINIEIPLTKLSFVGKAVKIRKIHLLEWGLIAPLSELKGKKPSIQEIATELGIEKIEFLQHVAYELIASNILVNLGNDEYEVTEFGRKLYEMGKMISDPRIIDFTIIYETTTKEWFIGAREPPTVSMKEIDSEEAENTPSLPTSVPDDIIKKHLYSIGILDKGEDIKDQQLINSLPFSIEIEANIILKNDGIEVKVIKEPLGEQFRDIFNKVLKVKLIENGEINIFIADYKEKVANYENITVKEYIAIESTTKLYSPFDEEKLVEDILYSKNIWIINANQNISNNISTHKNKPSIILHIGDKITKSTKIQKDFIIPSSIEIFTDKSNAFVHDGSIISEKNIAEINLIKSHKYEIPLYVVVPNNNMEMGKEHVLQYIEYLVEDKLVRNTAKFYIEPSEENFNKLLTVYPFESVKNKILAEKALNEIMNLRERINTTRQATEFEKQAYARILKHYSLEELQNFNSQQIIHIQSYYFEHLINQLSENIKLTNNSINTWKSIQSTVELCSSTFGFLMKLKETVTCKKESDCEFLSKDINSSLMEIEAFVIEQIRILSIPSTVKEVKTLYQSLDKYSDETRQYFLNRIWHYIENEYRVMDPTELLDICKFLKIKDYMPTTVILDYLLNNYSCKIEGNLFESGFDKKLIRFQNQFSDFSSIISIKSYINLFLTYELNSIPDKKQVELLNKNLSSLRSANLIDDETSNKILKYVSDSLSKSKASDTLQFLNYHNEDENIVPKSDNSKLLENPPIKKIIIDGSNVARQNFENGVGSAKQLLQAYHDLKNIYGFESIIIFIGAGLRHKTPDFDLLEPFIKNKIIQQTPAGASDDKYIIEFAKDKDMLIMTNDFYKEFRRKGPDWEKEISMRRTTYMIDQETKSFRLQFPDNQNRIR